jgi:hypothetical protein
MSDRGGYTLPRDEPNLLAFRVSANNTINDRGLASFSVKVILADGVNLDVFRVIDVDEFLVDI